MATDYVIDPDQFKSFFNELEARKTLLTGVTDLHKALTNRFISLKQSLSQRSQALDSQTRAFKDRTENALESLQKRENAIPERESALAARVEERKALAIEEIEKNSEGPGSSGERELGEALKVYCRRMDSVGLIKFVSTKRKETAVLRGKISQAVEAATDPMRLVLDAVEDFVGMKVEGRVGMADRRWACWILIQAALPVPSAGEVAPGGGAGRSLRQRAEALLQKWEGILAGGEGSGGLGASEATMFLQMVIGFGLKDKFEDAFLRKLVVEFSSRRDMAKLAVALGFGEKLGDIIDDLVKNGKEIEAVYFASESRLTERFSPITLLDSCIRNCRKNVRNISKNGNYSTAAVEKANNMELETFKAIIKCVEDHKLESQFSTDSLKKRITQLEKAKADKKKSTVSTSTSRPSNKRAYGGSGRASSSGPPFMRTPKAGRYSNASPGFPHRNPSQSRQTPAARFSAPFSYPSQSVYGAPGTAAYGSGYGGTHIQNPVALPQHYALAPQDVGPAGVRTGGSYGAQGSYGGQSAYSAYDYNAASAPTYPPSYPQ